MGQREWSGCFPRSTNTGSGSKATVRTIPKQGAAILTPNHSGMIPLDATMVYCDVLHNTSPSRVARPVIDHFVPGLPVISAAYARCGTVGGSRGNVHQLHSTAAS